MGTQWAPQGPVGVLGIPRRRAQQAPALQRSGCDGVCRSIADVCADDADADVRADDDGADHTRAVGCAQHMHTVAHAFHPLMQPLLSLPPNTRTHTHAGQIRANTQINTRTFTQGHKRAHMHAHKRSHAEIHTHVRAQMQTHMHARTHPPFGSRRTCALNSAPSHTCVWRVLAFVQRHRRARSRLRRRARSRTRTPAARTRRACQLSFPQCRMPWSKWSQNEPMRYHQTRPCPALARRAMLCPALPCPLLPCSSLQCRLLPFASLSCNALFFSRLPYPLLPSSSLHFPPLPSLSRHSKAGTHGVLKVYRGVLKGY
jgi:hypothetical protein